jgi:hypothetical protein
VGPLHLFRFSLDQASLRAGEVTVFCVPQPFARASLPSVERKIMLKVFPVSVSRGGLRCGKGNAWSIAKGRPANSVLNDTVPDDAREMELFL